MGRSTVIIKSNPYGLILNLDPEVPFDELRQAVANHTTEVLTTLKNQGIDVEWVQVGNETSNGMLFD